MAKEIFEGSSVVYLTLEQASTLHPIWEGKNLDIPLEAITPNDLVSLLGFEYDDSWIEWLIISSPIILVERQQKKNKNDCHKVARYYRVMGHATFNFLASYLGAKYGSEVLNKQRYPMTIIPQKKLATIKTQILNSELVFSFLLQKSKKHREIMRDYILSSPAPISQISSIRQLSKFAKMSHSSMVTSKDKKDELSE